MFKTIPSSRLLHVDARRVCLIKPSALGDVVQTLPLLPALRERFPDAEISWVINRELSELLVGHPHLNEIIPFDRRGSWSNWMQLLRDLRQRRFDLVFDLQGLLRTGVMTLATAAPMRVGLETAREGSHWTCNCIIPDTGPLVPAHLRYWRTAEALGLEDLCRQTRISIPQEVRRWAERLCHRLRGPVLAIHPGARWVTKRWPVERFAAVACKAMRAYGFSVLILGSRSEISLTAELEYLIQKFMPAGMVQNLTGRTTLKQLAACLSAVDVLLTNDSGPMHLASGQGTPVVAVFTCTSPQRSGPPGNQHELISTTAICAGSYKKKCPYRGDKHMACMDKLAVERVWRGFVKIAERNQLQNRAA